MRIEHIADYEIICKDIKYLRKKKAIPLQSH